MSLVAFTRRAGRLRRGRVDRMSAIAFVAVVLLVVPVLIHVGSGSSSSALGPVVAITPDQTSRPVINGFEPDISWRGEAVGASSIDPSLVTFVDRTNGVPDGSVDGRNIGVSGNGCVAVSLRRSQAPPVFTIPPIIVVPLPTITLPPIGLPEQLQQSPVAAPTALQQQVDSIDIVRTDRCNPNNSGVVGVTDSTAEPFSQIAVDFDGDVIVVPTRTSVRYLDTTRGVDTTLPLSSIPGSAPANIDVGNTPAFGRISTNGVDVSADGSVVVATLMTSRQLQLAAQAAQAFIVVGWQVGAADLQVLSTPDGSATGAALHPSISADGAFVSFVSTGDLAGTRGDKSNQLQVFVRPRSSPTFTPISDPARTAVFTSLSADGSQVAYATTDANCFASQNENCTNAVAQVEVAWSATPGLSAGVQREVVNATAAGAISGLHGEVTLSGSGRYVTWQTTGGGTLIGPGFSDATHVVLRARDASMRVDSIDFGAVPEGTSRSGTATLSNTGTSSLLISSIESTGAEFTVVGSGSCALAAWLAPGASCTIDVRFDAPPGGGPFNAELIVAETGFEALRAAGRLIGVSVPNPTTTAPPITPTTTTTTTTTVPPSTTTTTTTTTTIPGVVELTATPDPLDFGDVSVGIPTAPQDIAVTNTGTVGGSLTVAISGAAADDFEIVADACDATTLAVDATCAVSIRLVASDGGTRTATFTVTSGTGTDAVSATVQLVGAATFDPKLIATPDAVTENGITTVIGQGFPFAGPLTVEIGDDLTIDVQTDDTGAFQLVFEVFGRLPLGAYEIRIASDSGLFDEVTTPLLVVLDSFQPQGPTGPAFGDNLLVSRG